MTDIISFINARLDYEEKEVLATANGGDRDEELEALAGGELVWADWRYIPRRDRVVSSDGSIIASGFGDDAIDSLDAAHIARYDPRRILKEIQVKRAIVQQSKCDSEECACYLDYENDEKFQAIASLWSDHPDYNKLWDYEYRVSVAKNRGDIK